MTSKPHMASTQLSIPEAINLRHSTERGHEPSACGGHQHRMGHTGRGYSDTDETDSRTVRGEDPVDILRMRLAKGEITEDDFQRLRTVLESH